jgi:hypothetical protein
MRRDVIFLVHNQNVHSGKASRGFQGGCQSNNSSADD